MSRSHYPANDEPKRPSDVLPGAIERARRGQYLVHRKPAGIGGKRKGRSTRHYLTPPPGGWKGGA